MATVTVFDPPMCCSTGACGPNPDVALARFAADLNWLQGQGVSVQRYTLTQQPEKFTSEAAVLTAINAGGTAVLPIVMVDGTIVSEGRYPSREQFASVLGLAGGQTVAASKAGGCGCKPGTCC